MRRWLAPAVTTAMIALSASFAPLSAQSGGASTVNPQRDCQTIRTCRYTRGGSYRGCLSSYTCRVCRFVPARCEIGGRKTNCQEMRCTWGG